MKISIHFLIFFLLTSSLFAQWETDLKLSTNEVSASTNENMWPCLVTNWDAVYAVWWDSNNNGSAIFFKRSLDKGITWDADMRISATPRHSDFPALAVSGSNLHLVFRDNRIGKYCSYYKRSTDGGNTWGADVFLDTAAGGPLSLYQAQIFMLL